MKCQINSAIYCEKTIKKGKEKFINGKKYYVMRDYDDTPPGSFFRLKQMCYKLCMGQELRFRGPNFDCSATFLTCDGRQVMLKKKIAFRVVGSLIEEIPPDQNPGVW